MYETNRPLPPLVKAVAPKEFKMRQNDVKVSSIDRFVKEDYLIGADKKTIFLQSLRLAERGILVATEYNNFSESQVQSPTRSIATYKESTTKTQGTTLGPLAECGRFPKRTYTIKESKYSGTFERKKTMGPLKLPDLETGASEGGVAIPSTNSPFLFVVGGKNFIATKNKIKVGMKDAVRKIK